MKKFAVFGNPIAQSLSPTIHQMFAKSCGELIQYDKIEAPLDAFEDSINHFFADENTVGCNVTVPFKERAFAMAQHKDAAVCLAKAANTLMLNPQGELCAYNTDGIGLVADLNNSGLTLAGAKVLLLGAGGAARGVVHPLLSAGVTTLHILNRTVEKAQAIVNDANNQHVTAVSQQALLAQYDVVINSTSASLSGTLPAVPDAILANCQLAYDMVYAKDSGSTVFMTHAAKLGAVQQLDGLGMLVEQAAAAFAIWTGKQPATAEVIEYLRNR
ncbi:shikimate dehydrogenase [Alteromonas lipolytica]|uniref:Shikimate dehydrogenase (NADP(+)) n=1 Tax=Alteromonas lipolytica TaxID=1856405 RepID=A0A1E8FAA4_9ALTE|nr:shikimate dehydrogenase [Alteromonas lipolytica]OFI32845.1 shikimate dehydrogenase [Alteromonas lipolytica]GGF64818.1 shikimate dehydrogenase (NADP(+)) [Alteromonas lipolytica]